MSGMPLSASTMRYHTSQPNRPSHDGYNSFAESMLQQEVTGTVLASPVPDELYRVRLNNFTSDILGAIADGWIGLLAPQPDYQGTNPVWWPASITFMSPRRMLKHDRVMLLQQLLCGKLLDYSKKALEAALEAIPCLHNSSAYWNNLTKILDVFHDRQTHRKGTLYGTLQACEFGKELFQPLYAVLEGIMSYSLILSLLSGSSNDSRLVPPATSIRPAADPGQSLPAILADLSSNFCVDWLSYSSQGVPLHTKALTRCELRGAVLNCLEGPTLQQPSVAQEIRKDPRMGILKLVVIHNPLPLNQPVATRSYMAFSIRIAISLNDRIEKVIARGWEDIPGIIAEIETQYSV